jgi:methyl-accepting chemotaxis protein
MDCTIFDLIDGEFVRLHTSLTKESGESAEGSLLERQNPAYKALMNRGCYVGTVKLFGDEVDACYSPLLNSAGNVTGALMVCLDKNIDMDLIRKMTN